MTIVYGVDTNEPFTPKDVCSALVECFVEAHKKELDDMKEFANEATDEELERMKVINVRQMINNFFTDVGGDCDNPTKEDIVLVLERTKNFAKNFRKQEVIEGHYKKIKKLIEKL